MKNIILSLMVVLLASGCSHNLGNKVGTGTSQSNAAAEKSAEDWLALVDAGNYSESWKTAASDFQAAGSEDKWEHIIAAVRVPLGEVISRKLISARYTKSLPGAPVGEYVVLKFETSFANKKAAVETITPMLDADGTWRVSGYYIK